MRLLEELSSFSFDIRKFWCPDNDWQPSQSNGETFTKSKSRWREDQMFHLLLGPSSCQKARRALTLQVWGGMVNYRFYLPIEVAPCVTITKAGPWNSQKWPSAASILWRDHPGISSGLAADVLAIGRVLGGGHGCQRQPAGSCHVW